ncbi:MAG: MlaD family protein [Fibrobacterota bacterium]
MESIFEIQRKNKELFVGVFAVGAIVIMLLFLFGTMAKSAWFEEKYNLYAVYDKLTGLNPGAEVIISGQKVGTVGKIVLDNKGNRVVRLIILKKYEKFIRQNSELAITQVNFPVSDKIFKITPSTSESIPMLHEGDTIKAVPQLQLETVLDASTRLLNNLDDITASMARGEGSVGLLFKERDLYDNANRILLKSDEIVRMGSGLLKTTEKSVNSLNRVIDILPPMVSSVNRLTENTGELMEKASVIMDTASIFINDIKQSMKRVPAFVDKGEMTLDDAHKVLEAVKTNWFITMGNIEEDYDDPQIILY